MIQILIAFIIGFFLGKYKLKIPNRNKITITRKRLNDKSWLIEKHIILLQEQKKNEDFQKFECSYFFVGDLYKHNLIKFHYNKKRIERRRLFIESILKDINPNYYIKYIGDIPKNELLRNKRNNTLNSILNG